MRQRLSTIGIGLLILIVVLTGLAGCAQQSKEREVDATEPPARGASVATAPGETVVSAVTSSPEQPSSATAQPTVQLPTVQTPAEAQPAATPLPGEATAAPAPAGAEPADTSGGGTWHTVQPGETLSSIARGYGATWQEVAEENSLSNPNQIYVGQKLKIPTTSSGGTSSGSSSGAVPGCRIQHTVRQGEWVWQIARNYGVSPYDILAANGLTIQSANTIYPGTVLCIP